MKRVLPYHGNIEKQTITNLNYRNTLFTGKHSQLVIMNLKPKQQIGNEKHNVDQFFRVEQGCAKFSIDNGKKQFRECSGGAVIIPSGHYHNVINVSNKIPLKLYTIYSPANEPPNTKQRVKPK